jgi:hypothetical protein
LNTSRSYWTAPATRPHHTNQTTQNRHTEAIPSECFKVHSLNRLKDSKPTRNQPIRPLREGGWAFNGNGEHQTTPAPPFSLCGSGIQTKSDERK